MRARFYLLLLLLGSVGSVSLDHVNMSFVLEETAAAALGSSPALASDTCTGEVRLVWSQGPEIFTRNSKPPHIDWGPSRSIDRLAAGETFSEGLDYPECSNTYKGVKCSRSLATSACVGDWVVAALVESATGAEVRLYQLQEGDWGRIKTFPVTGLTSGLSLTCDGSGGWLLTWIQSREVLYSISRAPASTWSPPATASVAGALQTTITARSQGSWLVGVVSNSDLYSGGQVGFFSQLLYVVHQNGTWTSPASGSDTAPLVLQTSSFALAVAPFALGFGGTRTIYASIGGKLHRTSDYLTWQTPSGIVSGQEGAVVHISGGQWVHVPASVGHSIRWSADDGESWAQIQLGGSSGVNLLASVVYNGQESVVVAATAETDPRAVYIAVLGVTKDENMTECNHGGDVPIETLCGSSEELCHVQVGEVALVGADSDLGMLDVSVRGTLKVTSSAVVLGNLTVEVEGTLDLGEESLTVGGCLRVSGAVLVANLTTTARVLATYNCESGEERTEVAYKSGSDCGNLRYTQSQLIGVLNPCREAVGESSEGLPNYIVYIAIGAATVAMLGAAAGITVYRDRIFSFRRRAKASWKNSPSPLAIEDRGSWDEYTTPV